MVTNPGIYGIVAELNGRIAGSNFMDERSPIAGIGPISVDPDVQNSGAGRAMMLHMLDRVAANRLPGVRLVQTAYHNRSLCLYAKLGFEIREQLSVMIGSPIGDRFPATMFAPPPTPMSTHATGYASSSMDTIAAANCAVRSRTARRPWSSISAASPATRAQSDTPVTPSVNRTRNSKR